MRFGTAIERLVDNYQYAKSKVWIRDEVAWALYHTWKEADDRKDEPSNSENPNNSTKPTISKMEQVEDEPQTDCYVSDLCKHYGDKQICGRCRNRNLFCEAEPQPRCPKCGKRGYIRSLESMGVKLKVFDEYKWKCTNCNKYFKEEPKDEPQTDCAWK